MFSFDLKQSVVRCRMKYGFSYRMLEDLFGISKSTINRWVNDRNNDGGNGKEVKRKLLPEMILMHVIRAIQQNPYLTVSKLRYNIYKKMNIWVSSGTIYNAFRLGCISRKRVTKKLYYKTLKGLRKQQQEFERKIKNIDQDTIICLDETYVWSTCSLNYGRSIGNKRVMKYSDAYGRKKYSVLMAVTNKEVIAYEKYETSVNSEIFLEFLEKHIFSKYTNMHILMDNVSFHKTVKVREAIERSINEILYIPPYSPQYNPIEEVFSKIKNYIKTKNSLSNGKNIERHVQKSTTIIERKDLENYYKNAFI